MNIAINNRTYTHSDELLSILHVAESKHGSFNDFIFLEKPQHSKAIDKDDYFWTASTVRIEGDEIVKGYAIWDANSMSQCDKTTESTAAPWNTVSPHIVGLEWYNRKSPQDMARVIDQLSENL